MPRSTQKQMPKLSVEPSDPPLSTLCSISQKWLRFYELQKKLIQEQPNSSLTPFGNSLIDWYLRAAMSGTFTGTTFDEVKQAMDEKLFLFLCHVFTTVRVDISIPQPLTLYRCIYLHPLSPQKQGQKQTRKRTIPHKLPASWSFYKKYSEFWCSKSSQDGKIPYILEIKVSPRDCFVFNIYNETQYEVMLPPCSIQVDKIKANNVLACSIKTYYKMTSRGTLSLPRPPSP